MSAPVPAPYFLFPGAAHDALTRYQRVFGGALELHTYGEFGRLDGPAVEHITQPSRADGPAGQAWLRASATTRA